MTPTVSWIIPVKNGMPFLPDTLASLAGQTFQDFEVLVWDNGSTDSTIEELHRWIPARIPGRIVTGQPRGVGGALAGLVEISQAKFCARIDADDIALPDRLARQVAFLESHPEIAVSGGQVEAIDAAGESMGYMLAYACEHEDLVIQMLLDNPVGHPTVLFRRTAVLEAGNYHEIPNVEDYELWLRMAQRHRLANLPVVVTKYRIHDQSCTRRAVREKVLHGKLDAVFVKHAAELYGITPPEAMRLRTRLDSFTISRAIKIARHLSRTQGGSTWARLRNPSLIRNMRILTPSRDIVSRFAFAVLDRKSGSIWREFRLMFLQILMKLPGGKQGVELFLERSAQRRFRAWHRSQNTHGCLISERINFTGRPDGYNWVKTDAELSVEPEVTFWISDDPGAHPQLNCGKRVFIGRHAYLGVYVPITIGDNTLIGAYSYIVSANHRFESRAAPIRDQGYRGAPIEIGEDVWIGTHVVILPGVRIGKGAIIGAGSLVNRNIPEYEIWGGVPARFIKKRPL